MVLNMSSLSTSLTFLLAVATAVLAQTTPVVVLPLGDSITYGYYSSTFNGYRQDLLDLLAASNIPNVTYIGSVTSGTMVENENSGFPGATISQIQDGGLGALSGSVKPNLVLLHAGTNDAAQNHTATEMISDLTSLVDNIFSLAPATCVVLSEIIMNKIPAVQAIIKQYNSMIPALVKKYEAAGAHVVLVTQHNVDLYTDDNPQHLTDDTHPGDIGFAKMARNFYYGVGTAGQNGWVVL